MTTAPMNRADNSLSLAQANARRRGSERGRTTPSSGCDGRRYAAVAHAAGVSRSWLYSQDQIRETSSATSRTEHEPPARPRSAQRASTSSLRQRLDTATFRRSPACGTENRSLRDQIARQLGLHRMQPVNETHARAAMTTGQGPPETAALTVHATKTPAHLPGTIYKRLQITVVLGDIWLVMLVGLIAQIGSFCGSPADGGGALL